MKKYWLFSFIWVLIFSSCTTVGPVENTAKPQISTEAKATSAHPLLSQARTPAPTAPATPVPTPTIRPATYFHFEPGVNPLTGLPVADPSRLARRPVMVKISNWPREGRPHAGLMSADLIFEYFIGHQMNRFPGIYYGDDSDVIGPVRSGRLVDAQLTNLYQGILGYGNADPQVDEVLVEVLGDRAISFNEASCPAMCGESTHSATGVFANSGALENFALNIGVDNSPPDLRGMYFQAEPPPGDASGLQLRLEYANFSIMEWRYDPESGGYALWMEEVSEGGLDLALMTDRNNDKAVHFENVIVMYAEYIEYAPTLHDIVLQDVLDYRPPLLFRDGRLSYATWRVPEPDRPIIFETSEGDPLPLKPGRTWVVIVGQQSRTVHPKGGEWEVYFELP
ncbi:MAG: DUF3048 domain-containing protein [Brevefilum sp.]